MAERAGIFDPTAPMDYASLTTDTFNWNQWIEQETRKRYANYSLREGIEPGGTDIS